MTVPANPLPLPGSDELERVLPHKLDRIIYGFLYGRRADPPTMNEIIDHLTELTDETQAHINRRVRELYPVFDCNATRSGKLYVYLLRGWANGAAQKRRQISRKLRAQVLIHQRCAQCGKTPTEDSVKLEVDHKLPLTWGGTNDIENLQALCHECNNGKRDFYATFNVHADKIRHAVNLDEPHKRIGETLKAFAEADQWAPAIVVELVASMIQYQDDWQRRMRELRDIGWDYKPHKHKDKRSKRIHTEIELTKWQPWPEGNVAAIIKQVEKSKKLAAAARP